MENERTSVTRRSRSQQLPSTQQRDLQSLWKRMRQLTLLLDTEQAITSRRIACDSAYVSLSDLRVPVGKASSTGGTSRDEDARYHTTYWPLNDEELWLLYQLQDSFLVLVVVGAAVQVCWGCSALYSGELCRDPPDAEASEHRCYRYKRANAFAHHRSPDVRMGSLVFFGGWPLLNSLLHVAVAVAIVWCSAFLRVASQTHAHRSSAWLWLSTVQLLLAILDVLTIRRWKNSTCQQLLHSFVASKDNRDRLESTAPSAHCEYAMYEAFMFMEMLLAITLFAVVLLEPVLLRLWCSSSSEVQTEDEMTWEHSLHELLLLQDDDVPPTQSYRKL